MESFIYDAAGQKEQVTRVTVTTSNVTIPIGRTLNNAGISVTKTSAIKRYASNVVYSDNRISEILLPDGILKRTNAITSNPPVFSYNYYIKDHLGNVRTVIDGSGTIKQVNNYYPFGMEYGESAENQTMMTYQDYQYGGKEFDRKFEINLYDFHARPYDATRAQWTSPDPLAEKYYSISPYAYCMNNPMKFVDPDGRNPGLVLYFIPGVGEALLAGTAIVAVSYVAFKAGEAAYNAVKDAGAGYKEQQKRERSQKESLNKNQVNVQKGIENHVGKPSPDGTPDPKRELSTIGKIVIGTGLALEGTKEFIENTSASNTQQDKQKNKDNTQSSQPQIKSAGGENSSEKFSLPTWLNIPKEIYVPSKPQ